MCQHEAAFNLQQRIRFVRDGFLGEQHGQTVTEGQKQVGARGVLFWAAPQGLAVNGEAFGLRAARRVSLQDRFRPPAQAALELDAIQVAENPMQRTRTRYLPVRKAECGHNS